MTRILPAIFYLALIGTAAAQPPVDYILLCKDAVIGTAGYVDGELHVAVLEVVGECAVRVLALSVVGQGVLEVTSEWFEGVLTIRIGEMEAVVAEVLPQPALDGMVRAAENRGDAAEPAGQGQETAAEHRTDYEPELPAAAGGGEQRAAEHREQRRPVPPSLPEPSNRRP